MLKNIVIENTNISEAWVTTLNCIVNNSGFEITPYVLSLTEFEENIEIKKVLDTYLEKLGYSQISTVSETIFPQSLYEFCKNNKDILYKEYKDNLPRIKAIDNSNKSGTYFERLISYRDKNTADINQLEIIIDSLNNNNIKRRSKLQASIFNPFTDHKPGPYQSFPCLQHVTFYKTIDEGLVLNSFYAIQYLFRRGYGNWLGLVNLGRFVAAQTDLRFVKLNCFIGIQKLDNLKKNEAKILLEVLEKLI